MLKATTRRRVIFQFNEPNTSVFSRYGMDEDPIVSNGQTFNPYLAIGWDEATHTGGVEPDAMSFTARGDIEPLDRIVQWETMPPIDIDVWAVDLDAPNERIRWFKGRIKNHEPIRGEDPNRWKFNCESTKRMLRRSLGLNATEFSPFPLNHHFLRTPPASLAPRAVTLAEINVDGQAIRCRLTFPAGEDLTPELWRGGHVLRGGLALMILSIQPDGTVDLEGPPPSAWMGLPLQAFRGHDGRIESLRVHGVANQHSALGVAASTRSPFRTP